MNRATSLVVLLLSLSFPLSAAAQSAADPTAKALPSLECTTETCEEALSALDGQDFQRAAELFIQLFDESPDDEGQRGVWLVHAAFSQERAKGWDEAAALYHQAAEHLPPLRNYLLSQAVRTALDGEGDPEIFSHALKEDALSAGFPGESFLRARQQAHQAGLPDEETLERALRRDGADNICPWLHERLASHSQVEQTQTQLLQLAYAHCVDEKWSEFFARASFTPSSQARQERAEHLFWAVRFKEALAELDNIHMSELSPVQQCKATFRRARSHFRLRQYQSAHNIYKEVVQSCTDQANEDERVQSLYGMGNRDYHTNKLDQAQQSFELLLEQYPHRSHADDALFYLARIARQRGEREAEVALLQRALQDYPQGDMVHEMAWEVYESLFRSGEYQAFIDAVTGLPLPDWDDQYFSQGRLEYFIAAAHDQLGQRAQAARYWQLTWVKYPFSFYGYLSNLRLKEQNIEPERLAAFGDRELVDWFGHQSNQGAELLARAGHLAGACDFAAASLQGAQSALSARWQTALLCHRAGRFDFSHNLVRRQISGRPWTFPLEGQLMRWHIAWPNPFAEQIAQAVKDFGPAEAAHRLSPAFPSAIMREESSFIEDIVSWAGAVGLMQLMPATARDHEAVIQGRATVERLKTAEVNIPIGVDHLAHLSRRFEGHPVLMTAAYNAGAGRVNSWLRRHPNDEIALWVEDIPFLETRNYTKRVIGSYGAYQFLNGQPDLDQRVSIKAR